VAQALAHQHPQVAHGVGVGAPLAAGGGPHLGPELPGQVAGLHGLGQQGVGQGALTGGAGPAGGPGVGRRAVQPLHHQGAQQHAPARRCQASRPQPVARGPGASGRRSASRPCQRWRQWASQAASERRRRPCISRASRAANCGPSRPNSRGRPMRSCGRPPPSRPSGLPGTRAVPVRGQAHIAQRSGVGSLGQVLQQLVQAGQLRQGQHHAVRLRQLRAPERRTGPQQGGAQRRQGPPPARATGQPQPQGQQQGQQAQQRGQAGQASSAAVCRPVRRVKRAGWSRQACSSRPSCRRRAEVSTARQKDLPGFSPGWGPPIMVGSRFSGSFHVCTVPSRHPATARCPGR
jgi:hypothetical protein